jgi:hypothetical protein
MNLIVCIRCILSSIVEDYYVDILEQDSVINLLLTTQSPRVGGRKVCDIIYYSIDCYPYVIHSVLLVKLIGRYQSVVGHDSSRTGVWYNQSSWLLYRTKGRKNDTLK